MQYSFAFSFFGFTIVQTTGQQEGRMNRNVDREGPVILSYCITSKNGVRPLLVTHSLHHSLSSCHRDPALPPRYGFASHHAFQICCSQLQEAKGKDVCIASVPSLRLKVRPICFSIWKVSAEEAPRLVPPLNNLFCCQKTAPA